MITEYCVHENEDLLMSYMCLYVCTLIISYRDYSLPVCYVCLDPVMISDLVFVGADFRWIEMENLVLEDFGKHAL